MKKTLLNCLCICLIIAAILYFLPFNSQSKPPQNIALTVNTITPKIQPMPIVWKTIGTIQPKQTVSVTPQVTAKVKTFYFTEGDFVKVGDKLIELDPTTFKIALHTAQANLRQDQAKLNALQKDLIRYKSLIQEGIISQQEYDQQLSTTKAQEAQVQANKTQVEQAQIQLNYTTILSPLAGKTGSIGIHIGDLVTANVTTLLTINQLDPIQAYFSIPENQFNLFNQYRNKNDIKIEIYTDKANRSSAVQLNFIDNAVDPTTGTILLKALFDNSKELFWPNQSVQVEIILAMEEKAIVVPSKAVNIDQQGRFVYLVKDNKAVLQRVQVNREIEGLSVISEGLTGDEIVIINAPPNLQNGSVLKII